MPTGCVTSSAAWVWSPRPSSRPIWPAPTPNSVDSDRKDSTLPGVAERGDPAPADAGERGERNERAHRDRAHMAPSRSRSRHRPPARSASMITRKASVIPAVALMPTANVISTVPRTTDRSSAITSPASIAPIISASL